MEAYQQRVLDEKLELDVRISRLHTYISCDPQDKLSKVTLFLLENQLKAMREYSKILDIRISLFEASSRQSSRE